MVSRIVEQQQALSAVLAEDRKNWHKMPSDAEFSVLETMDHMQKNGLNNAHLAPGVLRWYQLQHEFLHVIHTFLAPKNARKHTEKSLLSKNFKELFKSE